MTQLHDVRLRLLVQQESENIANSLPDDLDLSIIQARCLCWLSLLADAHEEQANDAERRVDIEQAMGWFADSMRLRDVIQVVSTIEIPLPLGSSTEESYLLESETTTINPSETQSLENQISRIVDPKKPTVKHDAEKQKTTYSNDPKEMSRHLICLGGLNLMMKKEQYSSLYKEYDLINNSGIRSNPNQLFLVGNRLTDRKIFQGYFKQKDGTLVPGAFLVGFYSLRSAQKAFKEFAKGSVLACVKRIQAIEFDQLKTSINNPLNEEPPLAA